MCAATISEKALAVFWFRAERGAASLFGTAVWLFVTFCWSCGNLFLVCGRKLLRVAVRLFCFCGTISLLCCNESRSVSEDGHAIR